MTTAEGPAGRQGSWNARRRFGQVVTGAAIAAAVVIPLSPSIASNQAALARSALVLGAAAVYILGLRGVERLRLAATGGPRHDLLTIWAVFAALVLPPLHMGVVIVGVFALFLSVWRGIALRRVAIMVASTVVAAEAAGWVAGLIHDLIASVAVGTLTLVVVQALLVAASMLAGGHGAAIAGLFRSLTGWTINLATAVVGGGFALCVLSGTWLYLIPLTVATWALHWWAQHLDLVHEDAIDQASGLPTEAVWRQLVTQIDDVDARWTVVLLRPATPAQIPAAAQVVRLICSREDVPGRFEDGIAIAVRAPALVAKNLVDRAREDLTAIHVDCAVSVAGVGQLGEQIALLERGPGLRQSAA